MDTIGTQPFRITHVHFNSIVRNVFAFIACHSHAKERRKKRKKEANWVNLKSEKKQYVAITTKQKKNSNNSIKWEVRHENERINK